MSGPLRGFDRCSSIQGTSRQSVRLREHIPPAAVVTRRGVSSRVITMHRFHVLFVGLMLGMLTGCSSGKTVDATTVESAKSSLDAIKKSLPPAEVKQFDTDVMTVMTTRDTSASAGVSPKQRTQAEIYKSIDGMTASEIHAKAEELRASTKKPAK